MTRPPTERLREIKTLPQLVAYLRDELDWPISSNNTEDIVRLRSLRTRLGQRNSRKNQRDQATTATHRESAVGNFLRELREETAAGDDHAESSARAGFQEANGAR